MKGFGFMNEANFTNRNQSIDLLRVMSCFAVILIHVASSFFSHNYVSEGNVDWVFCTVLYNAFVWSVPMFAMITGFLFLNPSKELPLKKLYGKNVLRLVLALLFWTLFYAVTIHYPIYPFPCRIANFWYVEICLGIYVSMPLLKRIATDDKLLSYSCWIWLAIRFFCNLGMFVDLPFRINNYVFTEYIGYCLWGYYLTRVKLTTKQARVVYLIGVCYLIANTILTLVTEGKIRNGFENMDPFLVCAAIFLFVIRNPIHLSIKSAKIIANVAEMTFGILMVHSFVDLMLFSRLHRFFDNFFIMTPLAFLGILVLSGAIVFIIKQIPILKRWVV